MDETKDRHEMTTQAERLAESFHKQFAVNQNHHQNAFIQLMTLVAPLLAGYAFIFFNSTKEPTAYPPELLYAYYPMAGLILSLSIALIAQMGLGFRRDQLVAANIRIAMKAMNMGDNDNYFPASFNPQAKGGFLSWLPNFHIIFLSFLVALKAILGLLLFIHPSALADCNSVCDWSFWVSIAVYICFGILDLLTVNWASKKWDGIRTQSYPRMT